MQPAKTPFTRSLSCLQQRRAQYFRYKTHAPSHHTQVVLQQHISKRRKMDRGLKFGSRVPFVYQVRGKESMVRKGRGRVRQWVLCYHSSHGQSQIHLSFLLRGSPFQSLVAFSSTRARKGGIQRMVVCLVCEGSFCEHVPLTHRPH